MLRVYLFACALLCAVSAAHASAYSDFSIGLSAFEQGNADLAIASFTKAIVAGDLAPNLLPTAYLDRGLSYLSRGLLQSAAADLTMAQKLDPKQPETYEAFAALHTRQGDFSAAVQDYTQLMAVVVDPTGALVQRGRANWEAGNFGQALADFEKALESNRHPSAYDFLWVRIASASARVPVSKSLAEKEDDADLEKWPGPILALFRGVGTEDAVRQAAQADSAKAQKGQVCESDFYLAELDREHGNAAAAQAGFSAAVKACPFNFIESPAARAALKFDSSPSQTPGDKS
jgi:lipoprotein NlpI